MKRERFISVAILLAGWLAGSWFTPGTAIGSSASTDLGSIGASLDRIAGSLKEISRNVDNPVACDCRCK